MWSLAEDLLEQLRRLRGVLLTLAILFFIIMLLEVDLGHRPRCAAGFLAGIGAGGLAAGLAARVDGGSGRAVEDRRRSWLLP